MDISQFVSINQGSMQFTQQQASAFAKGVAGDFNPIHDVGAKRFCVPGDLIFSALLAHYGVYRSMFVDFNTMLGPDIDVPLPDQLQAENELYDANARLLLTMKVAGEKSSDVNFVSQLSEAYVQFSGKTFPDILVTLMRDNNAMINPARPLVIYKDMSFTLESFDADNLSLVLSKASLAVDGKKGKARLQFDILSGEQKIGDGEKNMVLSGLRDYDEAAMTEVVDQYALWKADFQKT